MNTRRYPRTLQEAFGPYTDDRIHEPAPDRRPLSLAQMIYIPALVAVIAWAILS
jgi:hypothetical protein